MKIETIVNGGVTLVLSPENEMEEAALKQLMNQDNDITEIRTGAMVLNRTFNSGIVIGKKAKEKSQPEDTSDESN